MRFFIAVSFSVQLDDVVTNVRRPALKIKYYDLLTHTRRALNSIHNHENYDLNSIRSIVFKGAQIMIPFEEKSKKKLHHHFADFFSFLIFSSRRTTKAKRTKKKEQQRSQNNMVWRSD